MSPMTQMLKKGNKKGGKWEKDINETIENY